MEWFLNNFYTHALPERYQISNRDMKLSAHTADSAQTMAATEVSTLIHYGNFVTSIAEGIYIFPW